MWHEFVQINSKKIKIVPVICWIALFFLVLVLALIPPSKNSFNEAVLWAVVIASLILPFWIMSLIIGFYEFRRRRKIFAQASLAAYFTHNSFKTVLLNQKTKLNFTEEARLGKNRNFDVVVQLQSDQFSYLQFQVFAEHDRINKIEFARLSKEFKKFNAHLDIGFICKKIKRRSVISEKQIESELNTFIDLLVAEKFRPAKKENWHT